MKMLNFPTSAIAGSLQRLLSYMFRAIRVLRDMGSTVTEVCSLRKRSLQDRKKHLPGHRRGAVSRPFESCSKE